MAIDVDPNSSFPVVLARHRDIPKGEQPRFWFRMGSRRDRKAMQRLLTEAKGTTGEAAERKSAEIEAALAERLICWEGFDEPFDRSRLPDALDDVILTDMEFAELLNGYLRGPLLTADEKKASGSPSPSSTGSAARSATTDATSPNGPNSNAPDATAEGATTAGTAGHS